MDRAKFLIARSAMLLAGLAASLAAADVHGQDAAENPAGSLGGVALVLGFPRDEFESHVDGGIGLDVFGIGTVDGRGILGLRWDGLLTIYGWESHSLPRREVRQLVDVSDCSHLPRSSDVDIVSGSVSLFLGPQLTLPSGAIRPYLNAGVGLSFFGTASFVSCTDYDHEEATQSSLNFGDIALGWVRGGGLLMSVSEGTSLFLSVQYVDNGRARYLPEDGIEVRRRGSLHFDRVESQTSQVMFQIGLSFQVGGAADRDP